VTLVVSNPAPGRRLGGALALRRGLGDDFETAWPRALTVALRDVGPAEERRAWATAFNATAGAWEGAYAGTAAPCRALAALAGVLDEAA
jgi:hypothetical protein